VKANKAKEKESKLKRENKPKSVSVRKKRMHKTLRLRKLQVFALCCLKKQILK
jgi:hypothetical protein